MLVLGVFEIVVGFGLGLLDIGDGKLVLRHGLVAGRGHGGIELRTGEEPALRIVIGCIGKVCASDGVIISATKGLSLIRSQAGISLSIVKQWSIPLSGNEKVSTA